MTNEDLERYAIAQMQRLARHGHAPGNYTFDRGRPPGMPVLETICRRLGLSRNDLAAKAGLLPPDQSAAMRGRRHSDGDWDKPLDLGQRIDELDGLSLHATSVRQEVATHRQDDGSLVRRTRTYYSLR